MSKRPCVRLLLVSFFACSGLTALSGQASDELRDPTRPLNFKSEKKTRTFQLQAIFRGQSETTAVINGVSVTEGSRINGWVVVALSPKQARLRNGSEMITLSLRKSFTVQK